MTTRYRSNWIDNVQNLCYNRGVRKNAEDSAVYLSFKTFPKGIPNEGTLFVDHQTNRRSGHLSHALVEYKPGCVLSFYSNCSGTRNGGHSGFGWLEYRRSADGGRTWDDARVFPYSWDALLNEPFTVSCEKAVSTKENEIVALCTRCTNPNGWEPYLAPTVVVSRDGGESWGTPRLLCDRRGRVYDALVSEGVIYVLFHAAPDWLSKSKDEKYYIYESCDGGESFALRGEVPIDPVNHAYGSMVLREDGALIVYLYNKADEYHLDYCVSRDMGHSFDECGKSFCAKRIRNPQVAKVKGGYLLHGRSGCETEELPFYFVLYTSRDGIRWDEGVYLCETPGRAAYYSNNLVLDGGKTALIQSSVAYKGSCVNVCQWLLSIE